MLILHGTPLTAESNEDTFFFWGEVPPSSIKRKIGPLRSNAFDRHPFLAKYRDIENAIDGLRPQNSKACPLAKILAEEFDRDPFMIFKFRGMPKEDLLDRLKRKRAGEAGGDAEAGDAMAKGEKEAKKYSLFDEVLAADFWTGPEAAPMSFRMAPPEVRGALAKRLGKPPFWDSGQDFVEIMTKYYDEITEMALEMAYSADDIKP